MVSPATDSPKAAATDILEGSISRRRLLQAVAGGGALAGLAIPKSALADGQVDCVTVLEFPDTIPLMSKVGVCETTIRIGGSVLLQDAYVDLLTTFHPPAGGVSNLAVSDITGRASSINLGQTPSGVITIAEDPNPPGSGTMNFNSNDLNLSLPVIITMANFPGEEYRTVITFSGSMVCTESPTHVYLGVSGNGSGSLPPNFPTYGGQSIVVQTTAGSSQPAQQVPAFGPAGLFTLTVGMGVAGLLMLRKRARRLKDEAAHKTE